MSEKRNDLQHKIDLWKQMQQMVIDVENRNFNILSFGTITTAITTILSYYTDKDIFQYINIAVPMFILLSFYFAAFNNKISAYIRGYLSGLEENINSDISEDIFLWNKGYSELFHKKYFPTNSYISVLYIIVAFTLSVFSFFKIYMLSSSVFWRVIWVLYVLTFTVFIWIFCYDLLTNTKSKQYARLYFHIKNHHLKISKLENVNNKYLEDMQQLLNLNK